MNMSVAEKSTYNAVFSRLWLLIVVLIYGVALSYSHEIYLNPIWEYYGFTFSEKDLFDVLSKYILIGAIGLALPKTIKSPGSIIIIALTVVVYVPTVVISIGLESYKFDKHFLPLLVLCFVFCITCTVIKLVPARGKQYHYVPSTMLLYFILCCWLACCVLLVLTYHSVMRFASLEEVYDQRAAGASTSVLIGYVQVYFGNVLSPALIAIGLATQRRLIILIGAFGCFLMYLIDAQRTIFLIPFVMVGVYHLWDRFNGKFLSSVCAFLFLSLIICICTLLYSTSSFIYSLSTYFVFRTLGIPGLSFTQYFDLFSSYGFTFWSHVKGIGSFVPPPSAFAEDPLWPQLGRIIGDRVYNNETNNVNANLFSGDGVAAAGAVGVLVVGICLAFWIMYLEIVSRWWDKKFIVLIFTPVALSLSNGHFSTVLLSFGGILWSIILVLPFFRKKIYN